MGSFLLLIPKPTHTMASRDATCPYLNKLGAFYDISEMRRKIRVKLVCGQFRMIVSS
jgi:hypothetical protein